MLFMVQAEEPHEEFLRIRGVIGRIMGAIVCDGLNPLLAEHPDLKPMHLRE